MTPRDFFTKWAAQLDEASRERFMLELATLLSLEQARERRRLCTDARLYRQACDETAAEISQQTREQSVSGMEGDRLILGKTLPS